MNQKAIEVYREVQGMTCPPRLKLLESLIYRLLSSPPESREELNHLLETWGSRCDSI